MDSLCAIIVVFMFAFDCFTFCRKLIVFSSAEGVIVCEKDLFLPKHPELTTIPNLHVVKSMQSLKSRGFVEENFAWRHYYWRLTNEGIQYLRDFLHLPAEVS